MITKFEGGGRGYGLSGRTNYGGTFFTASLSESWVYYCKIACANRFHNTPFLYNISQTMTLMIQLYPPPLTLY